jgi:hypothetical protein
MSKLREQRWHDLPRQSRLARLMWPQLIENELRGEVAAMSRNEGKRSPVEPEPVTRNLSAPKRVYVLPPGFRRK